jgi:hypothetical protein
MATPTGFGLPQVNLQTVNAPQVPPPPGPQSVQPTQFNAPGGTSLIGNTSYLMNPQLTQQYLNSLGNLAQGQQTGQYGLAQGAQQGQYGLANTGLQNAGALANTQQQGYNTLAAGQQAGQFGLENTALSGQYGLAEAQTQTLPNLINTAMQVEKFQSLFPYVTGILGQVAPLIGDIGGFISGGAGMGGGGFSPSATGGTLTTPQGVNTSAGSVPVPNQVISPGQANTMLDANVNQGNAAAVNQGSDLTAQGPLQQQLMNQMAAQNSSNLNNATTQFLSQLAPANAQQALSSAQLQELVRSNLAQQQLGFAGVPIQRLGGLAGMITGLSQGALGQGGLI